MKRKYFSVIIAACLLISAGCSAQKPAPANSSGTDVTSDTGISETTPETSPATTAANKKSATDTKETTTETTSAKTEAAASHETKKTTSETEATTSATTSSTTEAPAVTTSATTKAPTVTTSATTKAPETSEIASPKETVDFKSEIYEIEGEAAEPDVFREDEYFAEGTAAADGEIYFDAAPAADIADGEFSGAAEGGETYAPSADDSASEDCIIFPPFPPSEPPIEKPQPSPSAGLLTGGEWCDNKNFDFWKELINEREEWSRIADSWQLWTLDRTKVQVTCGDEPAENVSVKLLAKDTTIWEAVTDNTGTAYLFSTLDKNSQYIPTQIVVEKDGKNLAKAEFSKGVREFEITLKEEEAPKAKGLDLMFMIDTTGSMGDELSYLQAELEGVIDRVTKEKQISARLSVNFYRDTQDDYIVRGSSFTSDIDEAIRFMNGQYASGGGDYPEAVEQALAHGIHDHGWDSDSTKLMFLVLDAPPHFTEQNVKKIRSLLAEAAAKGIRIIPVASSGVNTETEFLCRSFAAATGGTYTFLTNHSGIGGSHLEPTIGYYQVEKLNDMLVRIICSYIS